ncbi:MobC family plasmid mobilization relaxosome protein [Actinomadura rudentiformis]|uniref:MobC family plasmid mobilization relaxosome protein n=1 Tax=Actinomadura rudentiformis TaxID=359158 RepID=A0A6H9Z536_9ACTN|nr:MobC family plasmid mobilization relaxosome protein [Actinomadura rudentiformis]
MEVNNAHWLEDQARSRRSVGGAVTGDEGNKAMRLERRSRTGQGRRRERTMRFRVSDDEYEEICEAATRKGMAYSAFIVNAVRLAAPDEPIGALPEICEELRAAARQVNRIGVNLNQLARVANSDGNVPEELTAALHYLTRVLQRLESSAVEVGRRLR